MRCRRDELDVPAEIQASVFKKKDEERDKGIKMMTFSFQKYYNLYTYFVTYISQ